MKLTLAQKILSGFIVCSVILITVAVFSFRNSEQLVNTNQWVNHTQEVLYEFEQVMISSVDAETGSRGFVITGDSTFLQPYQDAKTNVFLYLDNVKKMTEDNPEQQKNIEALKKQIQERLAFLEKTIELRKTKNFDKSREMVATRNGKYMQDTIRKMIEKSENLESELLDIRKKSSERDVNNFNSIFIILLIVIAIVLIAVYIIIINNLRVIKKAEQETANKNWTLTGSSELVKNMQGNKIIVHLTQSIINYLAAYVNAQVGALYLTKEECDHLKLSAGYAIDESKKNDVLIGFGEGLAGQSAAENRTLLFTDIPAANYNINTTFGQVVPKNIVEIPLTFEGRVIGVIELGSIYSFTELHLQYFSVIADSIAIAITSAQAREKTTLLLEETQRQAEELEAQQEELRQANEELQQKSDLLEESETELKLQQEELQQTNQQLEEKANLLEEQKEKLENAKVEIENKASELEISSKYKSEFLANMSHELRTPLNGILILSKLLSENKNKLLGEKEVEFANNIYKSGKDLLNLINDILDLSKIEAGRMELEITEVKTVDIINNMSALFTEFAKTKSLNFETNFDQVHLPPTIITDQQLVEQILKNLLSNAFKFTEKSGTVTLTLNQHNSKDVFKNKTSSTASNTVISFAVKDTGIGIPKNKQAIVFEAFQQADGSTKRKYGGTGLGLSISQQLANTLGGEIRLLSEEGKGSTFTLYIPSHFDTSTPTVIQKNNTITEEQTTHYKSETAPKTIQIAKTEEEIIEDDRATIKENDKVILIVEDDVIFAKILLDFVRKRNYKGIIATQGNTGVHYAHHYKPYAIILDMNIPVMSGSHILKLLKKDKDLRHIPVQVISAYDNRREGLILGAFDYLKKPVTTLELETAFDRIENFINKKVKKLLVVEDNETQNTAIKELIGNGDVKCSSAYTGADAYNILTTEEFDCIIVDLGLPDMSGFELMEKIKANGNLNRIPVVVYTGREVNKEENALLSKLANTVVLKTADSHERLLDETVLFLHKVESNMPKEKQHIIRNLYKGSDALKDKKILIVDDDMRNIYSLSNALQEEGINCLVAETGKAALDVLYQNQDIDLILMDVMMPEMDGYEATTEIRKIPKFNKLPIIALTAKAMKGDREKCLEVGMSDYIAKPVNIEQLISLMRVWLYQ